MASIATSAVTRPRPPFPQRALERVSPPRLPVPHSALDRCSPRFALVIRTFCISFPRHPRGPHVIYVRNAGTCPPPRKPGGTYVAPLLAYIPRQGERRSK